jgi:hypothetical protein
VNHSRHRPRRISVGALTSGAFPPAAASRRARRVTVRFAAAVAAATPLSAMAFDRFWVGGNGVWTNILHWSTTQGGQVGASPPSTNDTGYILHTDGSSRTVTYVNPDSTNSVSTLDGLLIAATGGGTNTVSQSQHRLFSTTLTVGYVAGGSGAYVHSGGTNQTGDLRIAFSTGSIGSYSLTGTGKLSVSGDESVGLVGNGTLTQNGGVHEVAGHIYVAVNVNAVGTFTLQSGSVRVLLDQIIATSANSAGAVNQSGGTNTVDGELRLGDISTSANGSYALSLGNLFVKKNVVAGNVGIGLFDHTGGAASFTATGSNGLFLGLGVSSSGTYNLGTHANLAVAGNEYVGYAGKGVFTQDGGVHAVNATGTNGLFVGFAAGASGTMNLSGDLTLLGSAHVGYSGAGRVVQDADAAVAVGGTLFIAQNAGSTGVYALNSGTLTAPATVNNGTLNAFGGSASLGLVTGNGTLNVGSKGKLDATSVRQFSLILQGTGTNYASAKINLAPGTAITTSRLNLLNISGTTNAWLGKLDVGNNRLILEYTGTNTTLANVRNQIIGGYSGGAWTGNGIQSSAAAGNPATGIGYAESADVLGIAGTNTASFGGVSVDATAVLVRHTLLGDATLDGVVDFNDLVRLAQNYNVMFSAGTDGWWSHGDFTYDGVVDFNDLVKLAQNYGSVLPAALPGAAPDFQNDLAAAAAALASVPEPTDLAWALAASGCAAQRRRTRR